MGDEWSSMKYAVLVPFKDIPREQIISAESVDTYTKGGVNLTKNSWIICPKGEKDKISKNNPGVKVMEYEGENAKDYANTFLSTLGYRQEKANEHYWKNEYSQDKYSKLMKKEGFKEDIHYGSEMHVEEEMLNAINRTISVLKVIKENGLVNNIEDIEVIYSQLNSQRIPVFLRNCLDYNIRKAGLETLNEKLKKIGINICKTSSRKINEQDNKSEIELGMLDGSIDVSQISPKLLKEVQNQIQNNERTDRREMSEVLLRIILTEIQKEKTLEQSQLVSNNSASDGR